MKTILTVTGILACLASAQASTGSTPTFAYQSLSGESATNVNRLGQMTAPVPGTILGRECQKHTTSC